MADSIFYVPPLDKGSAFAPLFQSPVVDRFADKIVRTPRTIGRLITGGPIEPGHFNPYATGPVGGESPAPAVPVVLPMWAADP